MDKRTEEKSSTNKTASGLPIASKIIVSTLTGVFLCGAGMFIWLSTVGGAEMMTATPLFLVGAPIIGGIIGLIVGLIRSNIC